MSTLNPLGIAGFKRKKKDSPDKKYATFNRRMLAATFDSLLLMVAAPFFNRVAPLDRSTLPPYPYGTKDPELLCQWMRAALTDHVFIASWVSNTMTQLLTLCIFSALCWHYWAATPGKMLLRMKIVDAVTEQPISTRQIVLRILGYFASTPLLFMGFFWIGIDKRRQGWHDKMAHTVVIILPWRKAKSGSPVADPSGSPAPSSAE